MHTDRELLSRYAVQGEEAAFGALVTRHLNLVYSAALRQTATRTAAEDVAQQVFSDLARKARTLPDSVTLAAWLHRATRFAAAQHRRAEQRRALREQEAHTMQQRDHDHPEPAWDDVRALLDESLDDLPAGDRDALLLRYFEQRNFADVGTALGATAEAARKRVDRALDRLRESLARRGVTTTAAALGSALAAHAVQVAPAGLAATLTSGSLAAATAVAGAGWLPQFTFLASMKTKTILAGTTLSAALIVPLAWQENALAKARHEQRELGRLLEAPVDASSAPTANADEAARRDRDDLVRLRQEYAALRAHLDELNRQAAEARPAPPTPGQEASPALATITLASAREVGQATPVALLETQFWATMRGDTNRLAQLMTAQPGMNPHLLNDRLIELQQEAAQGLEHMLAKTSVREIRILEEQPATEPTDRWVVNEFVIEQGNFRGGVKNRMLVRQTDTGWQLVLGLDGQPIGEEVRPDSQP